jgi:hypothetical protein
MCMTYVVMCMVMEISALHALHLTLDHATPLCATTQNDTSRFEDIKLRGLKL